MAATFLQIAPAEPKLSGAGHGGISSMSDVAYIERFWAKVDKRGPDECWPWLGTHSTRGYARFRRMQAHRFVYEQTVGAIPEGLTLDHLCRNRGCVNPAHLEPVTNRENVLRGIGPSAQNARKTCCDHGHEFTAENTHLKPDGERRCLTCTEERERAARRRCACGAEMWRGSARCEKCWKAQPRCARGHLYDDANTYWRSDGSRACRRCTADRQRRYQLRKLGLAAEEPA